MFLLSQKTFLISQNERKAKKFAQFKATTANQLAKFGKLIDKPVSNGRIDGLVAQRGKIHKFSEVAILFLGNEKLIITTAVKFTAQMPRNFRVKPERMTRHFEKKNRLPSDDTTGNGG